jgi:prepilin-type N-terminal cleavage/methylation domain-containing protein
MNPRPPLPGRAAGRSRGFTLLELLITITIIGLIAGLALGALYRAQESARHDKTRSIIHKLHLQMMARWDSYRTRRMPVRMVPGERIYDPTDGDSATGLGFAWRQLNARREMMRMDLPERWTDVWLADLSNPNPGSGSFVARTSLSQDYLRHIYEAYPGGPPFPPEFQSFQSAECLYMILTRGEDLAMGAQHLKGADVGDADQDGFPEFHDAWGGPISFLRWAPGFVGTLSELHTGDAVNDHDPFDPRKIHMQSTPAQLQAGHRPIATSAYSLIPLIYSPGPDGQHDLDTGSFDQDVYTLDANGNFDPYRVPPVAGTGNLIGSPTDARSDGPNHLDNIHNHQKGVE